MHSPEQHRSTTAENTVEQQRAAAERSTEIAKNRFEKGAEDTERRGHEAHSARKHAEAIFAAEAGKESRSGGEPTSPAVIRKITKREKDRAYKKTLQRIQTEMNAPARVFSKVIHSAAVEKTSEVIGSTAARPNALLFGSLAALIILSIIYAIGQTYGYRLSGFEMIAAYGFGWALGLIVDYCKVLAAGRLSS